jgi:cytochrome c peroxidase
MRRKILLGAGILILLLGFMGSAWARKSLLERARDRFEPIPKTPPALSKNPLTPEKIELGKMLYFDPRLSASGVISCNTCHNMGLGLVDLQETSIGHAWQKGGRNAPTLLNARFNTVHFWDGRGEDLAEQALDPVQGAMRMNNTPERVLATLKSLPQYVELFEKVFRGYKDAVTFVNVGYAFEAFIATLITPNARFDQYLRGDQNALTAEEKEGLEVFINKGCATCHKGVNLGGNDYKPFGLVEKPGAGLLPPGDKGRYRVTKTASDEFMFKVPSLRNIELTPPYFHSGKVWGLRDSVEVMGVVQVGVGMNEEEMDKITAFLRTLTGEQPKLEYPILPPNTDATPRPTPGITAEEAVGKYK